MVTGVTTDHAALKAELLWVSSQSFTAWGNSAGIWCFGTIFDNWPGYNTANALLRLLFAYDYMGRAAFTSGELDQLDRWFFDAADFWRRDMDNGINSIFVDRWNGNYTRTAGCAGPTTPFLGGVSIQNYAKFYNNRRASLIRFATLAGVYLQRVGRNYTDGRYGTQAQLVQSGSMFVKEFIRFSVFPQGYVGDFERRTDALPDLGWGYSGNVIGAVVTIADAFARTGDLSLYQYNTALGECGTAGTINDGGSRVGENRDLLFAIQSFMKYPTDLYDRYHLSVTADNRIDGRNPRNGSNWHGVHETSVIPANLYFRDNFVKQAYTRTHANSIPYGSNAISGPPVWMGDNGIFPGVLFMFGQMEDNAANPFLGGSGTSPIPAPNAPGNFSVSIIP
jgi:hypothetical protein